MYHSIWRTDLKSCCDGSSFMKRCFLFFFFCSTAFLSSNAQGFEGIFVDQEWLYAHQDDNSLIILHVDQPENYERGHIPGALYISRESYAANRNGLYFEMPDREGFAEELRKRGIKEGTMVILSSGWDTFAHAYRLYVTFEYFGLAKQVRILDGGIRGWKAKGYPVSEDTVITEPTDERMFLQEKAQMLVGKDWIRSNLSNPMICLIDARRENFYTGSEKGSYTRSGHIQGAKNLTWTTLVDDHFVLLSTDSLKQKYLEIVGGEKKKLILYCHVALRASVLYTVGKALGYEVYLYDGSYNEWDGLDDSYPVEN